MKKLLSFLGPVLIMAGTTITYGQTTLMTFNIRLNHPGDRENSWENRKEEVAEMIRFYQPGILGIQEGLPDQVYYLDSLLPAWTFIGIGRDGAGTYSESVAVFYDTTRFELIEGGTFWLSETPGKVSLGWDAAFRRISTWGAFRNRKTSDTLWLFNCHFDHRGEQARQHAAELMLKKLDDLKLEDKPVVIMGDFNATPAEVPIQIMKEGMDEGFEISRIPPWGPPGTYNDFDNCSPVTRRIDYIFTRNIRVLTYRHTDDRRDNGLCLSDHYPVMVEIEVRQIPKMQ